MRFRILSSHAGNYFLNESRLKFTYMKVYVLTISFFQSSDQFSICLSEKEREEEKVGMFVT